MSSYLTAEFHQRTFFSRPEYHQNLRSHTLEMRCSSQYNRHCNLDHRSRPGLKIEAKYIKLDEEYDFKKLRNSHNVCFCVCNGRIFIHVANWRAVLQILLCGMSYFWVTNILATCMYATATKKLENNIYLIRQKNTCTCTCTYSCTCVLTDQYQHIIFRYSDWYAKPSTVLVYMYFADLYL